jgi:hypothetical protein
VILVARPDFAPDGWVHESVWYEEVTDFQWGSEHDGRPFLLLFHPPHVRPEWVRPWRLLWFRWGRRRQVQVEHTETKIPFSKKRDPALAVILDQLRKRKIPKHP